MNSRMPQALTSKQKIFFLRYIIGFIGSGNASPPGPDEVEGEFKK